MLRLVQLQHPVRGRQVAVVEGDRLHPLRGYRSIYACAEVAIRNGTSLATLVSGDTAEETLDYDPIYAGRSEWRLLPAFDHPEESARCLVSGTGLTHRKSADNRHAMHQADNAGTTAITDSMRMYELGVQGGRPQPGEIGVPPEWFYKGCGTCLRAHGEPLEAPDFAEDGGEEPEIAAAYLVDAQGSPWRVGFAIGNEFADHQMESRNYLYLAPSKLRDCSLGPELLVGAPFEDLHGKVSIERGGQSVWSQAILSGEANMVHSLANLEHHHFKYAAHRRPGDAHIHFFGTSGFSFGAGVRLEDGDEMVIEFEGYGRPLRNPIRINKNTPALINVNVL